MSGPTPSNPGEVKSSAKAGAGEGPVGAKSLAGKPGTQAGSAPPPPPQGAGGVVFSVDLVRPAPQAGAGSSTPTGTPKGGAEGSISIGSAHDTKSGGGLETTTQIDVPPLIKVFGGIDKNELRLFVGLPILLIVVIIFWGAWLTSDRRIKRVAQRPSAVEYGKKEKPRWS